MAKQVEIVARLRALAKVRVLKLREVVQLELAEARLKQRRCPQPPPPPASDRQLWSKTMTAYMAAVEHGSEADKAEARERLTAMDHTPTASKDTPLRPGRAVRCIEIVPLPKKRKSPRPPALPRKGQTQCPWCPGHIPPKRMLDHCRHSHAREVAQFWPFDYGGPNGAVYPVMEGDQLRWHNVEERR